MLNYFRAILISWKWKLSHHTSRPHDVKEKGHPRKIKVVAWITLFFQFAFPLSLSFTPAIAAANTTNSAPTSVITPVNASILPPAARATEPYTLGPGDSIQSIAKKYNITVDELKKLNAYRTFSKPFASLTTGDEIEVPRKESSFFSNNPNENNKKDVDDLLARNAMGAGKLLSNDNTSDAASNMARSAVTNEINASSQQWLNQFGTARVQLNVDSDFKLDNSALDLLVPLKDSESSLLFTQLGVRNKDSRNTVNIGAGIRQYQGDWMYGANTFFDNDLTGKNRRVGVGAEVATDYLKFSANTYFGLTGWHQSRDFSSYDERPADGFDIRTEAYLPAYPQLGGKLMYEKYRGDEVALFGKDDRQKDPHAVTLGVNYTPVPLVTIGAEHREGKGNNNNTSVNVQLNYRMGQPWNDQIDQSAVAANRTLAGSRYDLVERNNNIVLDYKKQELIHLVLPDRISGSGGGAITLTAQVRAKYGFSRIEWDATPLENAGGSTSLLTQSSLSVTLPFYQHILRTSNTHTISAVAYDAQGNASNRAVTSIEVTRPETMVISHLATTVDNATANGIAANTVQATVTDGDGQPIIGQIINFAVNTQATLSTTEARTGANGIASTTLTHTVAGVSAVSATLGSSSRSVNTTFVADESTAEITAANLTVTTNDSVANGSDTNAVRAKVTDAYTNAVANQSVIFSASNGATVIDQTVITNAEGIADSTLTNTTAGVSAVTATLGSQSQQVDTTFKPGSTAAISLVKLADRAVADGIDQNEIQVVLRDGTGNAVPNVPMSIQADNGAIVVASTPNTGVDGTINATFTNLRAGESVVSVTSPALVGMTMTMTFSADPRTAVVSTLAAIDNNAKADGTDTNVVRAWVVDANGNSVPGVSVTFDAGNGAVLAQNPVVTDRNGYAENTLTNLAIGTTTVKATTVTDPVGQTVNTHFVAGAVDTITLTVPVNGAVANGVNTNSVQAVVSDSGGNPVTGATVVFSSTNATAQVTTVIGTTGVDGIATATLTNTVAGTSNVVATIGSITNNIDTAFVAGAVATITLTTPVNGAVANGADSNSVQAVVSDSEGNAVAGAAVVFSSANATAQITTVIGTTGADGIATATLTNTVAGTSNVVATVDTVNANIDTTFVAGAVATITLTTPVNGAVADGTDSNSVQAVVTDSGGNTVTGATVVFSSTNTTAQVTTMIGTTGADGIATATLTNTVAGTSNVVATIDTVNANIDTTFVAGAVATITLSVLVNDATADGADTNQVDALVQDANGNAITGAAVVFSSANGADIIAPTMNTGVNGVASTLLTHTMAGTSNVIATIDTVNANIDTTFVAGAVATITLSVPVNDATADGADTNQVDALVQDANGNAITGAAVVFSSANGATILSSTVNTGADGIASTTLTHTQSGVSNVVATIDTVNANIDTAFVAGAVATITLSVLVNDATADGADTNQVDALVQDANGNAITGAAVVFSSANGATIIVPTMNTGANGVASTLLTHTQSGVSNVVATVDTVNANIDTAFVPGAVATITLSVPVNDATADGADTNQVDALVQDANGNAITGAAVVFSSANGATIIVPTMNTGANGVASTLLTHTQSGVSNVVATVDTVNANIDTAFVPGAVATITLSVPVNDATADGADTNQVDALVQDANGNAITGAAVVFSSANGATIIVPTMNTGANGVASTLLTHTQSGVSNVVATIDTVNANIDTTFVAGAVATITLSVPVNDATADGADTNQVDALVQDVNGNAITGAAVVFSSANGATILSSTVNTGADGIASTTLTHTQSGVSNVVATIDTVNANIDTAFVAGELENIVVSIINNNALANGADTNIVEAFVTDRFGNGVANQSLMFGTNGASIVGSSTVTTNIDGRVRVSATHTVAGSSNTVFAISGAHQGYTRVTFVADASTAQLKLTSFLDNQLANGKAGNIAQALVTDAYDNPLANQSVSFALDNGAVIESRGDASSASGIVLMRFNNTLAGMTTVTATLDSTGQTETLEMHFVAGKAASIELTMTKDNAVANNIDTNEVQVLVTDADGNAINGAVVNLTSNSGMNITPNSVTTGSDGTATATLTHTLAGSLPINARIDQVSKTINATFIADVSTAQIIASDMFIIVNDQVANGQAVNAVQARVTDSYGNPIQGQLVEFVLSNTGTIQYKLEETSVEGGVMVTFTNTLAGITNVTATVVSSGSSQNVDTTFIADVTTAHIAESDLMVIVDNAVANNSEKNEVRARVTDAKGNVLSGQTVIFTSGNGAAITTVNGISDGDGLTKATLTHTLAGTSVVTARVGNQVQSKDTTFIADRTTATIRASDLTITRNNALADGVATNAARVIVTDAYGNPVPSMLVSYTSENGATLTPTLGSTDSSGMLSTTFTHTIAGISKVTATIVTMGISQAKDAVFIADRTTAHVSALTVEKNDSLANNSDRNIVQAHIQDAHGNVITGMNVNFSATENVTLAANMVTTNAQGYAENTLRHNAPVTSVVTATVATDLVGLTEDVRFVAGAGARIELFRLNDGAVADGIQTNRVEARVYDVSDNLVPNSNVVFSADNGGQLVQNDVQTDALGSAYVTVSNINTGVTKVSITADGVSASTTTTFIADKDTVTLRADLFLITHDNAVANGVTENRVLLQLLDANDNKVSGVEVNFTATNGASINASAITDTNGLAIGVLTNTLSGPSDVTVTLVTPGGTESLTVTPQFIADINTARIANGDFVIIDDGAVANSVDANEVRARVTDNQGNAIAGYSVIFSSQNDATITTSGITGVDGWASAKLTHTKAGESGILARILRSGPMVHTLTPYFIADVSTATIKLFPLSGTPIIADGVAVYPVLVQVVDANQNPIEGQRIMFSATNGAILSVDEAFSNALGGQSLLVSNTQAGMTDVTGTLVSNNAASTANLLFIANKNTAQLSTLMVVDNNALADGVARNQVRAHVVDGLGNPVADIAVTFTANHGAQLSHVTVLTDDNGDAVNTLTNSLVGVTVVTAKQGTTGTSLTVDTVFTAGPLATLTLVTMVDNAFADNSATNTVQATLKDATGNPIVGEVVAFAASNGATITATDGGVSNANGIVLATLTNGAAGVSTVTATIETLTATTETTFIAMKNLDVTVGDTTFDGDAGFPTTGFVGAAFKVNSGGDNSLYDWSSSAPALVSVSGEGVVTFNAVFPTGTPAITISATPKGGGSPLSYSFRVNQWFINNNGVALNRADAATYCANAGYTTVSSSQVTNAIVWGMGTRAMGNLWSEWGDFNNYNVPGWEPAEFFWLSDNYNATDGLAVSLSHGMLTTMGDPMAMIHVMCTRPI